MPLLTAWGSPARGLGFGAPSESEDFVFIDEIDVATTSTTLTFTNLPTEYTHFYVSGVIAYSNSSESLIYVSNQCGTDDGGTGTVGYSTQSLVNNIYNTSNYIDYANSNHIRVAGNNGSNNITTTSYKAYIQFANVAGYYPTVLHDYGSATVAGNAYLGMGHVKTSSKSGFVREIKFATNSSSEFCSPTRLFVYGLK